MLQREALQNKVVYFIRSNAKGVSDKTVEQDLTCGEISQEALDSYRALLNELYVPILQEQGAWGKTSQEHVRQFLAVSKW